MYYAVYKITNQVNGKIYVGVHKTPDLNDDYMGSGKLIKRAQEKYGAENFTREYLQVFDNAEDMFKMESELVNEEFVARDDTYNLKLGGQGGWDYCNATGLNVVDRIISVKSMNDTNEKITDKRKCPLYNDLWTKSMALNAAKARIASLEKNPNGTMFGRNHSEEARRKIGAANSIRQSGCNNSQFGTIWITNGTMSKKIKTDEPIPDGFIKGRKQLKKA